MSPKYLRFILLSAFALITALAGGYTSFLLRPETPTPSLKDTAPASIQPALTLPIFSLNDLAGNPRSIDDFTGQPLLINFWATWCAPCLRELPMLEAVWQERSPDHSLQIVGIAIDRMEDVRPYLEKTGVSYPNLVGQSDAMEAAGSFGPNFAGLPFTAFVTADRQILLLQSGELLREQLEAILSVVDAVAAGRLSVAEARTQLNHL